MSTPSLLAIIPARSGSKRLPHKNVKLFLGKPLLVYTIEQAKSIPDIGRIIVDTDSDEIAAIARHHGAEVPFLRPQELAGDTAQVADSVIHVLDRLGEEEYVPDLVMVLQATSPLRERDDITRVLEMMNTTNASSVVTVAPTHPRLYHLSPNFDLELVNPEAMSTNIQAWPSAYKLNGCFVYLVRTDVLRRERALITSGAKAVVCDAWRSVDIDTYEDWVLAEFLYTHRDEIAARIADSAA